MPKLKMLLLCSVALGLMCSPIARADRYVVAPGTHMGTPTPPYDTWDTAATNIQVAVDAANDGETIWVSNGTYKATGAGPDVNGINMVYLNQNRKLRSVNGPEVTILDGGYPAITNRLVGVNSTGSVLSGFAVINGCAGRGGGILFGADGGTVSNCLIYNNISDRALSSDGGGGIASYTTTGRTGYFYNCSIYDNTAISNAGGGAWLRGTVVLRDCEFYTNRCELYGGGCYIDGNVTMIKCVFSNNYASPSWGGGGIHVAGNKLIAEGCTIVSNSANTGGGINIITIDADSIISNCIISGNTTASAGGGYANLSKKIFQCKVVNCIISSNKSTSSVGGGAYLNGVNEIFDNCLIEGNYGHSGGGIYVANTNIACITNCTIRNNTAWYRNGGGGVFLNGAGRIVGCLIVSNDVEATESTSSGGGIKINSADAVCESCTVVENSVNSGSSGGIYMGAAGQVINTVIYGNTARAGVNQNWGPTGRGTFSNCCTADTNGMNGASNIAADPKFVNAAAGNYRLSASSPCVNAGLNQDWMTSGVDLDKRSRLDRFTRRVDIGCYEHLANGVLFMIK